MVRWELEVTFLLFSATLSKESLRCSAPMDDSGGLEGLGYGFGIQNLEHCAAESRAFDANCPPKGREFCLGKLRAVGANTLFCFF